MRCPVCKHRTLTPTAMEEGLAARHCGACGGRWLRADAYARWRSRRGGDLPEHLAEEGAPAPPTEPPGARLCPECGHILTRCRVGHGVGFALDACRTCGGVWLDAGEWEALRARNLHDDIHRIPSAAWQREVRAAERDEERERLLLERFGPADLAELRRVKAWLDAHPSRAEMLAFLSRP
jgi:Zn-finger nucleic acid-binding protein